MKFSFSTVNVASRMESTGKAGAIQVTQETCEILQTFGFSFEQRGLVAVKGKGQLMTYYLLVRHLFLLSIESLTLSVLHWDELLTKVLLYTNVYFTFSIN